MRFVLASASPRRLTLLAQIGILADVRPSNFNEVEGNNIPAELMVRTNALGKGRDILSECAKDDIIIAADTVVVLDNKVIGKPRDEEDAKRMLITLSGKEHKVITGVAVFHQGRELVETVITAVRFRKLAPDEIDAYISTGEPLDKAGAYGIQGYGTIFVEAINGCYNNVVGLPLARLYQMLAQMEVKLF